mmetsp:Transcript_47299/g.78297  ORF Transcript_47299/g.78297 Transcript_47299/m.78297 type:complete len:678 (+) Transcript_47299:93-2126(+)
MSNDANTGHLPLSPDPALFVELRNYATAVETAHQALRGCNLHDVIEQLTSQVNQTQEAKQRAKEVEQRSLELEAALEKQQSELKSALHRAECAEEEVRQLKKWKASVEQAVFPPDGPAPGGPAGTTPSTQANNKRKPCKAVGKTPWRVQRQRSAEHSLNSDDTHMAPAAELAVPTQLLENSEMTAAAAKAAGAMGAALSAAVVEHKAAEAAETEAAVAEVTTKPVQVAELVSSQTIISDEAIFPFRVDDLVLASKQPKGKGQKRYILIALYGVGKLLAYERDESGKWKVLNATEQQQTMLLDFASGSDSRHQSSITLVSSENFFACINGSVYFRWNYFLAPVKKTEKFQERQQKGLVFEKNLGRILSGVTQVLCHPHDRCLMVLVGFGSITVLNSLLLPEHSTESGLQFEEVVKPTPDGCQLEAVRAAWTNDHLVVAKDEVLMAYTIGSNARVPTRSPNRDRNVFNDTAEGEDAYRLEKEKLDQDHKDEVERWKRDCRELFATGKSELLRSDCNTFDLDGLGQPRMLLHAPPDPSDSSLRGHDLVLLVWSDRLQLASVQGPIVLMQNFTNVDLKGLTAARHFVWQSKPCWLIGAECGEVTVLSPRLEKLWQRRLVPCTASPAPAIRQLTTLECSVQDTADGPAALSSPRILVGFSDGCIAEFSIDKDSWNTALQNCD